MDAQVQAQWAAVLDTEPEQLRYPMRLLVTNFDDLRVRTLEVAASLLEAPDAELAEGCRLLIRAVEALDQRVRDIHLRISLSGGR